MKKIALLFCLSASFPVFATAPAELLAPDILGRPQIKITGAGSYYVFRSADGYTQTCSSPNYALVTDSTGHPWCRSTNAYPQGTTLVDRVPLETVAENSPVEYEYKVGTSTSISAATYIGWAPQIAVSGNPVDNWLQEIKANFGITAALPYDADDFFTDSPQGQLQLPINVIYGGDTHKWHFYYNNKYIALFNQYGGLLGLTHKSYGMEFLDRHNNDKTVRAMSINDTYGPDLVTPTVTDGQLFLDWSSMGAGLGAVAVWNLKSYSDSLSSSGLNGYFGVSSSTVPLTNVRFPYSPGLFYGQNKRLYTPRDNSGKVYAPFDTSLPIETQTQPVIGGKYPSSGWQSQYLVISDGPYSLYMATEDELMESKDFEAYSLQIASNPQAGITTFNFHPIESSLDLTLNYYVVLSPMAGGWEKASQKYRRWATAQTWGDSELDSLLVTTPGTLIHVEDRNIPADLKAGVFWWSSNFNETPDDSPYVPTIPSRNKTYIEDWMLSAIGGQDLKIGVHLYAWYVDQFDTNNPRFVPHSVGTDTWNAAIAALQSKVALVVPYINSSSLDIGSAPDTGPNKIQINWGDGTTPAERRDRTTECPQVAGVGWWNQKLDSSHAYTAENYAIKTFDGQPVTSCPAPGHLLASMDLSSPVWQSIVHGNVATVLDLGANGVYLDTFANADTYRANYNPVTRGTAVGYGPWLLDGIRTVGKNTMLQAENAPALSGQGGARRMVASEHLSEAALPYVDIVMNYHNASTTERPMLQSVYNDYQLMAGQRTHLYQSEKAKTAVLGRSFVWGYQLGLASLQGLCSEDDSHHVCDSNDPARNYLATLAAARQTLPDSPGSQFQWHRATLVGLADDSNINNFVDYSGADAWCPAGKDACPAVLPVVRGALWSHSGTAEADYLVLTNTSASTVASTIPLPKAWLKMTQVYPVGASTIAAAEGNASVSIGGYSVLVYKKMANADGDNLDDAVDNCPTVPNNDQADMDGNHVGDVCQQGLTGEYFNALTPGGTPAFTRIDSAVDFDWVMDSPVPGVINDEDFSIAWNGHIVPPVTGTYQFCTTSDDGARLWVDGEAVIDKWIDQAVWRWCGTISLTGRQPVPISLEYYDTLEEAVIKLTWSYPGQTETTVPTSALFAR